MVVRSKLMPVDDDDRQPAEPDSGVAYVPISRLAAALAPRDDSRVARSDLLGMIGLQFGSCGPGHAGADLRPSDNERVDRCEATRAFEIGMPRVALYGHDRSSRDHPEGNAGDRPRANQHSRKRGDRRVADWRRGSLDSRIGRCSGVRNDRTTISYATVPAGLSGSVTVRLQTTIGKIERSYVSLRLIVATRK